MSYYILNHSKEDVDNTEHFWNANSPAVAAVMMMVMVTSRTVSTENNA